MSVDVLKLVLSRFSLWKELSKYLEHRKKESRKTHQSYSTQFAIIQSPAFISVRTHAFSFGWSRMPRFSLSIWNDFIHAHSAIFQVVSSEQHLLPHCRVNQQLPHQPRRNNTTYHIAMWTETSSPTKPTLSKLHLPNHSPETHRPNHTPNSRAKNNPYLINS